VGGRWWLQRRPLSPTLALFPIAPALVIAYLTGSVPPSLRAPDSVYTRPNVVAQLAQATAVIPSDAPVNADSALDVWLANRHQINDFPDRLDASSYVVIDRQAYLGGPTDASRPLPHTSDVLCRPQPELVTQVHRDYSEAGADIITTNTFTATRVSQADYGLEDFVYEMNLEGARLARRAADRYEDRFIAGSLGPTNVTLSLSPRVDDPSYREVTFDQLRDGYAEAVRALKEGGV